MAATMALAETRMPQSSHQGANPMTGMPMPPATAGEPSGLSHAGVGGFPVSGNDPDSTAEAVAGALPVVGASASSGLAVLADMAAAAAQATLTVGLATALAVALGASLLMLADTFSRSVQQARQSARGSSSTHKPRPVRQLNLPIRPFE